jgi:hypothetical protein
LAIHSLSASLTTAPDCRNERVRELADDRRRSSKHAVGVGGEIPLGQKIESSRGNGSHPV